MLAAKCSGVRRLLSTERISLERWLERACVVFRWYLQGFRMVLGILGGLWRVDVSFCIFRVVLG